MIRIFHSRKNLRFQDLAQVYEQSLAMAGRTNYGSYSKYRQLMEAEQDFYQFVNDFLREPDSFIAVWEVQDDYTSALRIQEYKDGFLLTGLETASVYRGKGYASALVAETLAYLSASKTNKIYSHIRNENAASIKLHLKMGFVKISDSAAYLDGSADHHSGTYLKQL